MILKLRFHHSESNNRRFYKYKCRTLLERLSTRHEEIHAMCGDESIPVRLLDGVYIQWGKPMLAFVRI